MEEKAKRTIDERLDALLERHEALTQTVELIVHAQAKTDEYMAAMMQAIQRLANTASIHNLQIDDVVARVEKLERDTKQ